METDIVKHEEVSPNVFVMAKNPQEMRTAQFRLVTWAERKIKEEKAEHKDFQTNLHIATKNKWRTETLKRAVNRTQKKIEFYEKVKLALEAGYCIVPDMDIDLFAIRTTKMKPKGNLTRGKWSTPGNQKTDMSEAGEGRYVAPSALYDERQAEITYKEGKPDVQITRWASEFTEVDFPFRFAKPEILEATAAALKEKIFDEVGILPRQRGADPMVIGRVTFREGYQRKSINFVIAWFVDTKDL